MVQGLGRRLIVKLIAQQTVAAAVDKHLAGGGGEAHQSLVRAEPQIVLSVLQNPVSDVVGQSVGL